MQKLKMNLDALVVESFETAEAEHLRGTVRGNASYVQDTCLTETDENSCPGSCEPATCDDGCNNGTWGCGGETDRGPSCQPTSPWGDTCCQVLC